jgi:GGDEF domain-containing protein
LPHQWPAVATFMLMLDANNFKSVSDRYGKSTIGFLSRLP